MSTIALGASLLGCGLDGARAEFLRVEGEYYILKDWGGRELTVRVDERTRKDQLEPGDSVQVYYSKDGHAEFIVRL